MSLLGLSLSILFYVLTLMIILCENEVMKNVLTAVFLHFNKVVATFIMLFILLYFFASITFFSGTGKDYNFGFDLPCSVKLWDCV